MLFDWGGVDLPTLGLPNMNSQSSKLCLLFHNGGIDLPKFGLPNMSSQSRNEI